MREKRQSFCQENRQAEKKYLYPKFNSCIVLELPCMKNMFQWKKTLSESVNETKAMTQWKCFVSFGVLFQISDSKLFRFVLMLQSISTGTKRWSKIFLRCFAMSQKISLRLSFLWTLFWTYHLYTEPFLDLWIGPIISPVFVSSFVHQSRVFPS